MPSINDKKNTDTENDLFILRVLIIASVFILISLFIKPVFSAEDCTQMQQQNRQKLENSLLQLSQPIELKLKEKQLKIKTLDNLITTANTLILSKNKPMNYMGKMYPDKKNLQQQVVLLKDNKQIQRQQIQVLQQQLNNILARVDNVQWQLTLCYQN